MIYFGKEDFHIFLRTYLYDYILKNYETILNSFTYTFYNGEPIKIEDYIPKIIENGTYSVEIEISLIAKILNIFISIYEYQSNIFGEIYKSLNLYGKIDDKNKIIIILQYNNNTKHYKIINNNFNNENQKFKESDIDLKLDADLFQAIPDSPKYFKKKTPKKKKKLKI